MPGSSSNINITYPFKENLNKYVDLYESNSTIIKVLDLPQLIVDVTQSTSSLYFQSFNNGTSNLNAILQN